jgi:hypothetical protein
MTTDSSRIPGEIDIKAIAGDDFKQIFIFPDLFPLPLATDVDVVVYNPDMSINDSFSIGDGITIDNLNLIFEIPAIKTTLYMNAGYPYKCSLTISGIKRSYIVGKLIFSLI